MKSLTKMSVELPGTYKSFRKFIDDNVFGEGEEEVVHPSEEAQRKFVTKFDAEFEKEKARQKGMQGPGERTGSRSAVNEPPHFPPSGPVVPVAPSSQPIKPLWPQTTAGVVWDGVNWSCAYDSVFMSFWSIYKKSPPGWRDMWMQQAPKWSGFLKKAFDSLITMAQNERISQAALSREFTAYRNAFRNLLSQVDPTRFKRFGPEEISVYQVLSHIFTSSIESQPHLDQVVVCNTCGGSANVHCSFALLGSIELLTNYLDENDTAPRLPLDVAVTRYVQRALLEPHNVRCSMCSGQLEVQSLSVPNLMSWLWIEPDPDSPVSPSPHLVFDIPGQRRVYTLEAIIYGGGRHFTARLSDQSGAWWKYDGMWSPNLLQPDRVEDEADLLENDGRVASYLLYSLANIQS